MRCLDALRWVFLYSARKSDSHDVAAITDTACTRALFSTCLFPPFSLDGTYSFPPLFPQCLACVYLPVPP